MRTFTETLTPGSQARLRKVLTEYYALCDEQWEAQRRTHRSQWGTKLGWKRDEALRRVQITTSLALMELGLAGDAEKALRYTSDAVPMADDLACHGYLHTFGVEPDCSGFCRTR